MRNNKHTEAYDLALGTLSHLSPPNVGRALSHQSSTLGYTATVNSTSNVLIETARSCWHGDWSYPNLQHINEQLTSAPRNSLGEDIFRLRHSRVASKEWRG